jgi:hypothetical protein
MLRSIDEVVLVQAHFRSQKVLTFPLVVFLEVVGDGHVHVVVQVHGNRKTGKSNHKNNWEGMIVVVPAAKSLFSFWWPYRDFQVFLLIE